MVKRSCGGSALSSLAGSVQLAERTMCSRYNFMNRHLPKLLIMVIAMIIPNAGAARQRAAERRARRGGQAGKKLEGRKPRNEVASPVKVK